MHDQARSVERPSEPQAHDLTDLLAVILCLALDAAIPGLLKNYVQSIDIIRNNHENFITFRSTH